MDGWAEQLPADLLNVDDTLEQAFEAMLAESSTLAFRVAYSVLRHRQDAEDVAQEAFVRAHQRFRQIRERDKFRAWLVRLTWRLAIDRRRGDRRRLSREAEHAREQPLTSTPVDPWAGERAALLWSAVDALPDKLRVVIVLANMDGHDVNEVARLLAVPVGTVKSRLFQARQQLKERLSAVAGSTGGTEVTRWQR